MQPNVTDMKSSSVHWFDLLLASHVEEINVSVYWWHRSWDIYLNHLSLHRGNFQPCSSHFHICQSKVPVFWSHCFLFQMDNRSLTFYLCKWDIRTADIFVPCILWAHPLLFKLLWDEHAPTFYIPDLFWAVFFTRQIPQRVVTLVVAEDV